MPNKAMRRSRCVVCAAAREGGMGTASPHDEGTGRSGCGATIAADDGGASDQQENDRRALGRASAGDLAADEGCIPHRPKIDALVPVGACFRWPTPAMTWRETADAAGRRC